ncbi:DUF7146 domain-containing protein [Hyphomicrobium sp.]|uniref:DUF7146 domain-containing protein n=1 Tax=Hyphomicrobium sp. TaxID=82 RepID=UPI002E32A4E8|nr:toprim domain-containing protein [Hyphomicrobium sp.]HEX2842132.1 toprim domain-containing protein [Hyphomicrobium sp.]
MDLKTLSRRLADNAEAVCAHYLSNGKRHGRYWLVGDVFNTPGRSLYVRLYSSSTGKPPGKWADAANPDHYGDLLDLIRYNQNISSTAELRREALRFLSLPSKPAVASPAPRNSPLAASRLFHASVPILGTLGERYLSNRNITASLDLKWLRFHPGCYYKPNRDATLETHPAIIAAITDLAGSITGALRIYLDPYEATKANLEFPRLAMGNVLGHGIRLGQAHDVMAAGEGLETMLALRSLMPLMPVVTATSASHLGGLLLPPTLKRLYIAVDNDPAGLVAAEQLAFRHIDEALEIRLLISMFDDWNTDLMRLGAAFTIRQLLPQLAPQERLRLQSWQL